MNYIPDSPIWGTPSDTTLYGIGVVMNKRLLLNKYRVFRNNITALFDVTYPPETDTTDNQEQIYTVKFKDTDINVAFFLAITNKVPSTLVDEILKAGESTADIPFSRITWFDPNQDFADADIYQRLDNWMRESGVTHRWIIDESTDLTGDLLAKFTPYG